MADLLEADPRDPRRGIDRVLLAAFWRPVAPGSGHGATVVPLHRGDERNSASRA